MTFHIDAVYEGGVLRPLRPLELSEHQVVSISISTGSDDGAQVTPDQPSLRNHAAFLNSFAPEDEGLYDDYSAG